MGNLWSVESALNFLKVDYLTTNDYRKIGETTKIILPGVGSFKKAMKSLNDLNLTNSIKKFAKYKKNKIFGICLGFQLLANSSEEESFTEGLGLIDSKIEKFSEEELCGNKLPHIGFSKVSKPKNSKLFNELPQSTDFYFVHSYKMPIINSKDNIAICNHGCNFVAAYEKENIFGVQFHPEKSQSNGIKLLKNFLSD